MDEHGNGEFPFGEHRANVRQMGPDCLHIVGILAVIDDYFNGSAIRIQPKVMGGLVMRESHRFITMFVHIGLMLRGFFHMLFVRRARPHFLYCQLQGAALVRTAVIDLVFDNNRQHLRAIFQSASLPDGTNLPVVITIDGLRIFREDGD
jgi:hypothetical protein